MPRLRRRARGLTLMELLVSIMIMGIMIAVAVPVIRPPVDARSVKEAARMVSTALASARTKSIETGRSWGVEFTPFPSDSRQVGILHFVRVTSPYTGTGTVDDSGNFTGLSAVVPASVLSEGGSLKLGNQGGLYSVPTGGSSTVSLDSPLPANTYDFQFYPAPKKSSLMPIQLPSRAVVDMGLSGVGDTFGNNDTPIQKITFTKTGEVDQFHTSLGSSDATERIHFFIGKTGRIDTASSEPEDNHLYDGEAIWVSVDPRTGAVKSAENYPVNGGDVVTARTWAEQ